MGFSISGHMGDPGQYTFLPSSIELPFGFAWGFLGECTGCTTPAPRPFAVHAHDRPLDGGLAISGNVALLGRGLCGSCASRREAALNPHPR